MRVYNTLFRFPVLLQLFMGIALTFLVGSKCCAVQDDLEVEIKFDSMIDGVGLFDRDTKLRVVLRNPTKKKIVISSPVTRKGFFGLTFDATNVGTGEKLLIDRKRAHVIWEDEDFDEEDLADDPEMVENEEETYGKLAIPPDGNVEFDLSQPEDGLALEPWFGFHGFPASNTRQRYSIQAILTQEEDDVELWSGKSVSKPYEVYFVSLNEALESSDFKEVEYLVNHGIGVDRKDLQGQTPLHVATRKRDTRMIEWLLERGADVNAIDNYGNAVLFEASNLEVLSILLRFRPDLDIRCRERTVLQEAVFRCTTSKKKERKVTWTKIVDVLLEAGADYDILTAIYKDDLKRVQEILNTSPKLLNQNTAYEWNPLRLAAALGRFEICKFLVTQRGIDLNQAEHHSFGYPIIVNALSHPEVVDLLIKHGADVHQRILRRVGMSGPPPTVDDDATPLHYAVLWDEPETIRLLLDAGAKLDAMTRSGQFALDIAVKARKMKAFNAIIFHKQFKDLDPEHREKLLNHAFEISSSDDDEEP